MTWVKTKRPHECRRPIMWPWVRPGDRWVCDTEGCGNVWVVYVDRYGYRVLRVDRRRIRVPEMPLTSDPRRPPKGPGAGQRPQGGGER